MNILRAGLITGVATASRLAAGLVIVKFVAIFAGPVGVAKMGQFMSVMSLLAVVAGGGAASGITKYIAEYRCDESNVRRLAGTSLLFTIVCSCVIGVCTLVFRKEISIFLLGDEKYVSLICVLSIAQGLVAVHNYLLAIINGYMDVRRVAVIHIVGAAVGVCITAVLSWLYQLYGALLALVLGQALLILVSGAAVLRAPFFSWVFFRVSFDATMLKRISRYATMTLVSASLPSMTGIWVRNYLADLYSWEQVGYWQAVSKVSEAYLLFFTMAINAYYLPKLSSIVCKDELLRELKMAYQYIMPVVVGLAIIVFVLKDFVLSTLFSGEFNAANFLFAPQLVGDVIKIASYILSYLMLAKALTKAFLFSEIFFALSYVVLVQWLAPVWGISGAVYAFVLNYGLYLAYTFGVVNWYVKRMPRLFGT